MKKPKLKKYPDGGEKPTINTVDDYNKELSKYKKISTDRVPLHIAQYNQNVITPYLKEYNTKLDSALRAKYKLDPEAVIGDDQILTPMEATKVLGNDNYKTYSSYKTAYNTYRDKTNWEARKETPLKFAPSIGDTTTIVPAYDKTSSTMFNPYPTFKHGGTKLPKYYNGGEPIAPAAYEQEKPGYQPNYNAMVGASSMATANFANVYQDPDATTSDKAAAARQGAAQIAGSINPMIGGIIGGVDAIAQPVKNNAEQMNSKGQLTNRNKARAGAIAGNILSPSTLATTIASGKWDLKGDKYLNELEGNAQAQIAAEQAPMLAAAEAKRNMYYTYAQGGVHSPYTDPNVLKYNRTIEDVYPNLNQIPNYIDPNLLNYNKTIEDLKYKRTIEPLKFKRTIQDLPYNQQDSTSSKYSNGGIHSGPANAEIEREELVRLPNGDTHQVDGKSHEQGGIPVNLPDGAQIFSDRLKDPTTKKTFAKMAEKYKIKDVDDKANHLAKSSKELVDQIKQRKLDELFAKQEQLKQAKLNKYAQKLGLNSNMFAGGGLKRMDVPEDPELKSNFYNDRNTMTTAVDSNGQPIFFNNDQITATDDLGRSAFYNRADLPMTVETARESFNYRRPTGQFDNLETIPSIKQNEIPVTQSNTPESLPVPGLHVDTSTNKPDTGRKMNPDWIEPATNTLMQNVGNLMYLKDQGKKYDKQEFYKYSPELYNPADALRQADIEARVNRGRLKDATGGNAGALMSNLTQSQAINTLLKSKIRNDAFNQNANTLNDAQLRNIQGKYNVDDINARNKGQALTNYYKAIQGIGMNTTAAYTDWKRGNMDKNTANMLSSMFSNYGLDINNPNDWKIFYKKASNKE